MITKNAASTLEECLASVRAIVDEIIVVDDYSTDDTREIAKKYQAKIYLNHAQSLSSQRQLAINKAKNQWVLFLDADEVLSNELRKEIKELMINEINKYVAFYIPYQNHFFGRRLNYGGEDYRMIRLVKKNCVVIKSVLVHEKIEVKKGKVGFLKNKIYHYSYRSLWQMFKKFTSYAILEAKQKKINGEKTSLKKIILYPIHMFYARFIEDKGYKDGIWRIPLDLGFAYMEFLTYFLLLIPWLFWSKKER